MTPDAIPKICVCTPTDAAVLHTSELLTTTDGALAVGGVLLVTTVDETVLVSAPRADDISPFKNQINIDAIIIPIIKGFLTNHLAVVGMPEDETKGDSANAM